MDQWQYYTSGWWGAYLLKQKELMTSEEIILALPYEPPFLFVDELTTLSEKYVKGSYTFKEDEYFYSGHFKNNPVTPGVILIEVMAQIGLVCMGMCMHKNELSQGKKATIALTSSQVDFFIPIFPGEKVTVESQREYFRFNKLKCKVSLYNEKQALACRGMISGMMNTTENE
jgi:3-hydroxyacyl-[acyl-carrier-protein] dehydratase